jgi:hypothetical protein
MNLTGLGMSGRVRRGLCDCLIDGKRQYLHRDGEFTPIGRAMYNEWQDE